MHPDRQRSQAFQTLWSPAGVLKYFLGGNPAEESQEDEDAKQIEQDISL